ncbi:hypothetical protein Actkin_03168 [Actinokineospora sp. UTMC 2448]|nr:hypothetical protein Actkin_03168 [Actinokineospora sp. UTMC 2448]
MLVRDAYGAISIDGSGGDDAQDLRSVHAGELTIYEIKSYVRRLTAAQKRKIKQSCMRAITLHRPQRWVLIMPLNRSPAEAAWFDQLGAEVADVKIEWWGQDWLDAHFAGREDLISYVEGPDYRLLARAKLHNFERQVVATGADLAERMESLIGSGNDISPYWRLRFDETEHGLMRTIVPRRPDSHIADPIQITPTFQFPPDDPNAQQLADQLRGTIEFGGDIEVPGRFVTRLQVTAASDATRRLLGDEDQPGGTLRLTSVPDTAGLPLRGELVVESPVGLPQVSLPFILRDRVTGTHGTTLRGADPNDGLIGQLRIGNTTTPGLTIILTIRSPIGAYSQDVLPAFRLMAALQPGCTLSFRVGPEKIAFFQVANNLDPKVADALRMIEAMNVLQDHLGVLIPIDVPASNADHHDLLAIADALQSRPAPTHFSGFTATVPAERLEHFLATVPDHPTQMRMGKGDYAIALGDREYDIPGLAIWAPDVVLINRDEILGAASEAGREHEAHFASHRGRRFFFIRDEDLNTAPAVIEAMDSAISACSNRGCPDKGSD